MATISNKTLSAETLLYGRRRLGNGPGSRIIKGQSSFNDLRQAVRNGSLPNWLTSSCPALGIHSEFSDENYQGLAPGESHTHGYINGLDSEPVELSMVVDCGRTIIALDYNLEPEDALVGGLSEQKFFKTLAHNINEEITIEMTAYKEWQVDEIIDTYPSGLSLTISDFSRDFSTAESFESWAEIDGLSSKARELFKTCSDLDSLLADTDGKKALKEVVAYDGMLTFRRPLSEFS